jgi:hypothetical protein
MLYLNRLHPLNITTQPPIQVNAKARIFWGLVADQFLTGAERQPLCGPRRPCQDGQKLPVRAVIQPDHLRKNFYDGRFGAIGCDWVLLAALSSIRLR